MRGYKYLITLLMLSLPGVAWACGGFFYPDSPVRQDTERIIFTVNDDKTITTFIGINYEGEPSEFSWLLPVPSIPEIDVAENNSLDVLQDATNPSFIAPYNACSALSEGEGGGGGGGGIFGSVGPYEYAILGGQTGRNVIGWLKQNDYNVPLEAEPIIQSYLDKGMYFVAMRLKPDEVVAAIQPVKITFKGDTPSIPIRLASLAAAEYVPIYTWIFADTPYQAANYANITPDFSIIHGNQQLAMRGDIQGQPSDRLSSDPLLAYDQMRRDMAVPYAGKAFITEFQGSPKDLPAYALEDPLISDLAAQFPVLTRLRAELKPEEMTTDIVFAPAPDLAPVSNVIDLSDYVANALDYWGCTNEHILTDEQKAILPPPVSRIALLRMELRLPEAWMLQHFEVPGRNRAEPQDIWAAAPETLTTEQVVNVTQGEVLSFPVLLIYPSYNGFPEEYGIILRRLKDQGVDLYLSKFLHDIKAPSIGMASYDDFPGFGYNQAFVTLVSTPEDLQAHEDLYKAMVAYPGSYQNYVAADLLNGLFLTGDTSSEEYAYDTFTFVGYPATWSAQMGKDRIITVAPQDTSNEVRIIMTPIPLEMRTSYDYEQQMAIANERYGFPADTAWRSDKGCFDTFSLPFEKDGRTGFVRITSLYWVETSAPTESADLDELKSLSDSIISHVSCG